MQVERSCSWWMVWTFLHGKMYKLMAKLFMFHWSKLLNNLDTNCCLNSDATIWKANSTSLNRMLAHYLSHSYVFLYLFHCDTCIHPDNYELQMQHCCQLKTLKIWDLGWRTLAMHPPVIVSLIVGLELTVFQFLPWCKRGKREMISFDLLATMKI